MKSIERYIREKLNRPDGPAEVDADDLWASIERELEPASEPAPAPWPWRPLLFGVLLLTAVGLTGWIALNKAGGGEHAQLTTEEAEATSGSTEGRKSTVAPQPINQTAERTEMKTDHERPAVRTSLANSPAISGEATRTDGEDPVFVSSGSKAQAPPAPAPAPAKPFAPTTQTIAGEQTNKNADDDGQPSTPTAETNNQASGPAARSAIVTTALPARITPFLAEQPLTYPTPVAKPPLPFRPKLSERFSLGAYAGANLLLTRYAAPAEGPDALNPAVRPAGGGSFGLDLRYRISGRIALSAGLKYHRTLNTFEHTIERDSTIEHPSPLNNGPIPAVYRHRVADNLRTRFLTVPLTVHAGFGRGNFRLTAGAGVDLNFRRRATGTTLTPRGDFASFDAENGSSPTPEFFLGYRFTPGVVYRPKPKSPLSLEAKADLRYLPFGADELSGLKRNSLLAGLSVGLRYGL